MRDCRQMGFRMFSFQPAAFIGNQSRWKDAYREFSTDEVWQRIEEGVGARLHYNAEQVGDVRCNRTAHGIYVGDRYETLLDEDDPRDARALADFIAAFGGMDFEDGSRGLRAVRCARAVARHPAVLRSGAPWARRLVKRLGGPREIARSKPKAVTYVMHAFMDARHVRPAWELLQRGEVSEDPKIRETQERLRPARTRWRTPRPASSCRRARSTRCSTRWRTRSCSSSCRRAPRRSPERGGAAPAQRMRNAGAPTPGA